MIPAQLHIDFSTQSPINIEKITGQNKKLYEYLTAHTSITMFEAGAIGIGYLNSRISDLRNRAKLMIYSRFITRNEITCCEYSLKPFEQS